MFEQLYIGFHLLYSGSQLELLKWDFENWTWGGVVEFNLSLFRYLYLVYLFMAYFNNCNKKWNIKKKFTVTMGNDHEVEFHEIEIGGQMIWQS